MTWHSVDIIMLKGLDSCLTLQPMSVDERLVQFLKEARDWEKKATNIPGLFLLKLPGLRGNPPSVVIEINPVDTSGTPTKKRGVVVRSVVFLWGGEWLQFCYVYVLLSHISIILKL